MIAIINIAIAFLCSFYNCLYVYFAACLVISFFMVFAMAGRHERNEYKTTSYLLTFILPLLAIYYAVSHKLNKGTKSARKEWLEILYRNRKTIFQSNETMKNLKTLDDRLFKNYNYVVETLNMPCYQNVNMKYFSFGESYFKELYAELRNANRYILLELHKIVPGKLWNELFDILRIKAREGVNVKLIYDDEKCTKYISSEDFMKMHNHGIETVPFNKVKKINTSFVNYRNQKKFIVIDGKIAFMGGFDIDDSFVTNVEMTPATKDCGLKIVGEAVKNLIIMFFEDYQYSTKRVVNLQEFFTDYQPSKAKDWCLAYSTNPVTHANISKNILLNAVYNATTSISILTPYVALDKEIRNALILALKSGVKVRLIFADNNTLKKVKNFSRTYFYELIRDGVEVYEYKGGRMSSNLIMIDDHTALISTNNLDYGDMTRHFNGGVFFYGDAVVLAYNDVREIVTNSQLLSIKDLQKRKVKDKVSSLWRKFFRNFK